MENRKVKNILSILAIILIIVGFGIIHSHNKFVEHTGSVLLGIGTLYFLYLLFKTRKKNN